jgi:hypothetical protein
VTAHISSTDSFQSSPPTAELANAPSPHGRRALRPCGAGRGAAPLERCPALFIREPAAPHPARCRHRSRAGRWWPAGRAASPKCALDPTASSTLRPYCSPPDPRARDACAMSLLNAAVPRTPLARSVRGRRSRRRRLTSALGSFFRMPHDTCTPCQHHTRLPSPPARGPPAKRGPQRCRLRAARLQPWRHRPPARPASARGPNAAGVRLDRTQPPGPRGALRTRTFAFRGTTLCPTLRPPRAAPFTTGTTRRATAPPRPRHGRWPLTPARTPAPRTRGAPAARCRPRRVRRVGCSAARAGWGSAPMRRRRGRCGRRALHARTCINNSPTHARTQARARHAHAHAHTHKHAHAHAHAHAHTHKHAHAHAHAHEHAHTHARRNSQLPLQCMPP